MRRSFAASFTALAFGALLLSPVAGFAAESKTEAKPAAASAFSDKQRAEINEMIKTFITKNPEVLIGSVEAHYNKQEEVKKAQEGRLTSNPEEMVDANTPTVGPKDAKVTVIEFFDYNCGYCKQVSADVERMLKEDKTVRFAFKELPILSQTSEVAARYALAANRQGKYLEFHNAVMDHQGGLDEDFLIATGKSLGLDVEKLKTEANAQDVRDILAKNLDLAHNLGVRGTPYFVIGKQKIPGAIGYSNMKDAIARERGDTPAPSATTTPTSTTTTDSVSTGDADVDPDTQKEINKAKAETNAMIDDLKNEALKIQKEALETQKKLQEQLAVQQAKDKADKEKADKEAAEKADKK